MDVNKDELKAWLLLTVLALIWGSSFILIKKSLLALAPDEVGALRILSASVFLLPFALLRIKRINKKHLPLLLCVGFVGSLLPAFLFAAAQTRIESATAGILNALTPLFTISIGYLFFNQRFNKATLIGLILGFAGTALLVISGSKGNWSDLNFYALFVVLATIFYGINLNLIKYKIHDLSSVTITSISIVMVGPLALLYLWLFTPFFSEFASANTEYIWSATAIVVLGVMGTAVALIMFNQLVKLTQPVFASSVTYLIPIVAVIWGLIDGEVMRAADYLGLLAIISGVYLANIRRRQVPVTPKA
ncbi:MAG: DMT family transporter [Candidatus Cyclobacteriaceae bacterium M2_1C_046]